MSTNPNPSNPIQDSTQDSIQDSIQDSDQIEIPPHSPKMSLLTLPTELLLQILSHLSPRTLTSLRLTSHRLEPLAFPLLFRNIPNWLDYKTSHAAIIALANDAYERPSGMWSPWASEPDRKVEGVWLELLWRVEMRGGFVLQGGEGGDGVVRAWVDRPQDAGTVGL